MPDPTDSGRFDSGQPAGDRIARELMALRAAAEAAFTPPPVEHFRVAARRRTRRRAGVFAAALTALAGIGGGTLAVADRGPDSMPRPSPTGITSSSPAPSTSPSAEASPSSASPTGPRSPAASTAEETAIVDALFLQPGDVGSGYRVVSGGEVASNDWTFEFTSSALACQPPGPNSPGSIATRHRTLSRGTPPPEDILAQYVARYRPGDAGRYLDQVRARVNACSPGNGKSIKIAAERFAGEDALLIQVNYGDGFTTKHVLVRQGDLLTEFFTKPERSTAAAQDLATTAALRLCQGTPVC
jgi:hypothetical protein